MSDETNDPIELIRGKQTHLSLLAIGAGSAACIPQPGKQPMMLVQIAFLCPETSKRELANFALTQDIATSLVECINRAMADVPLVKSLASQTN